MDYKLRGFFPKDEVEEWASKLPSAAWDTTPLGKAAMKGLVGLKTAASLSDAASAQAQKLQQVVEVARIRATEAQRAVAKLQEQAELDPNSLFWQIGGGAGFGNPKSLIELREDAGSAGPMGMPAIPAPPGAATEPPEQHAFGRRIKPKIPIPKPPKDQEVVDMEAYDIGNQLDEYVEHTRDIVERMPALFKDAAHSARRGNIGWRSAADLLKYPGQPVEPLPGLIMRPRPSKRPGDLAPSWMDFLYASTAGSDPYAKMPSLKRDQRVLPEPFTEVEAKEVHNVFGSPPLPPGWVPEDSLRDAVAPRPAVPKARPDPEAEKLGLTPSKRPAVA